MTIAEASIPYGMWYVRIQDNRCIFDDITPNLPIMRRAYVASIVLATVFSMAWYTIVMHSLSHTHSLVVYSEISHLSLASP